MIRDIPKPWGSERIICANDKYVVKKLFINPGCRISLQYHQFKEETMYMVKGICKLWVSIPPFMDDIHHIMDKCEPIMFTSGMDITIQPGWVHRIEAVENTEILECSTPELWDVERIEDDYQRVEKE